MNIGIKTFRIDGTQMNYKDYKPIVDKINHLFEKTKEPPAILFDLKGHTPLVSRIGGNKNNISFSVKKGQIIKFSFDDSKISNDNFIFLDKKITKHLNLSDTLFINESFLGFKVIGIERLSKNHFTLKDEKIAIQKKPKSSPYLPNSDLLQKKYIDDKFAYKQNYALDEEEWNYFYDEKDQDNVELNNRRRPNNRKNLSQIKEEDPIEIVDLKEDQEFCFDSMNFDSYLDEIIKNKQENIETAYKNIMKRHSSKKGKSPPIGNNSSNHTANKEIDLLSTISLNNNSETPSDIIRLNENIKNRKRQLRSMSSITENQCLEKRNNLVICRAMNDGVLYLKNTISILRNRILPLDNTESALVSKDIIDLSKITNLNINLVSAQINTPENIDEIRDILSEEDNKNIKIYSRIETLQALINFDKILEKSDGIIINRGMVNTSLPYDELCMVELYILDKCRINNIPILIQTILRKPVSTSTPLVNEISTFDYALKEGIDSLIIEDDIQDSSHYIDLIRLTRDTILKTETFEEKITKHEDVRKNAKSVICETLLFCAVKMSHEIKAGLIILFTDDVKNCKAIVNYRPPCLIGCPNMNQNEVKYLRTVRGVCPFHHMIPCTNIQEQEKIIKEIVKYIIERNFIKDLDKFILVNTFIQKKSNIKNGIYIMNGRQFIEF
jgi:pyruvate kinase